MDIATVSLFLATAVLLGLFEGAILARLFRLPFGRCAGRMLLGNLLVSWIGFLFLPLLPHEGLHPLWPALAVVAGTWAVILLLQWPFVAACVHSAPGWLRRSVRGALVTVTAGYVPLLAVTTAFSGVGRRFAEDDFAAMAHLRADLRNLVTAEEAYFAEHVTYARSVADLREGPEPFAPDSFDVVTVVAASDSGWSATARRELPPALARTRGAASRKVCGVFVGAAAPPVPGQPEGETRCR